jgi:proliferating cell nuclear antigen
MNILIRSDNKVKKLSHVFHHIKNITSDVNIYFTSEQVYIQTMDNSHASLLEVQIKHDWFDEYSVDVDQVAGVNCEILFKVISCLEVGQEIHMSMVNGGDHMHIELIGKNTITKSFKLALMDIDATVLEVPDKVYQADIVMPSEKFRGLVQQLCIFSDMVTFKCNEDGVGLSAKGDIGEMTAQINEEDIYEYAIEEGGDLSVSYGLSFVERVCAFSKLSDDITIHCSAGVPMKLSYSLDDSNDGGNFVRFFLAPKIDDE